MKKIWIIALVVTLIACVAVCFTACGMLNKLTGNDDSETYTEPMKSAEEIKAALGNNYIVTVKVSGSSQSSSGGNDSSVEYFTTAYNGTYSWYGQEGAATGVLLKHNQDNSTYMYSYDTDSGKYDSVSLYGTADQRDPFYYVSAYVFYSSSELTYSTKTSTTFLNRSCTKYTYSQSYGIIGYNESVSEEWIVDNTTGAILKHSWDVSASAGGESGSANASFECTRYDTNASTVNSFIDTEVAKIIISEWDTTYFAQAGLTGTIAAPSGQLVSASYYKGDAVGDLSDEYTAVYKITGAKDTSAAQVNTLIQSFFTAGANRGEYTDEVYTSWQDDNILETDEDGISFKALIGTTGSNRVEISADYYSNAWFVDISVTKPAA